MKIARCVVELAQGRAEPPVSVRYFALSSRPCRYRLWAEIRTRKLIPSRTTDVWNPNRALTFYAFECEQSDRRAVWRLFSASQPSGTKAWGRQLTQASSTYVALNSDDTSAAENLSIVQRQSDDIQMFYNQALLEGGRFHHILGLHMHPHTGKPGTTLLESWKDSHYLI
jgi:hypothetical protein